MEVASDPPRVNAAPEFATGRASNYPAFFLARLTPDASKKVRSFPAGYAKSCFLELCVAVLFAAGVAFLDVRRCHGGILECPGLVHLPVFPAKERSVHEFC